MIRDPYQVLGVEMNSDPETIRARYLKLVHQFPPERHPREFSEIRQAYEILRDPVVSLEKRLFDLHMADTFDTLLERERGRSVQRPVPTDVLLSLSDA